MTVTAFCSLKGSPGVTTALLALADVWDADSRLTVVECDPSGNDAAGFLGLRAPGGLRSLAARARGEDVSDALRAELVSVGDGVCLLPGPHSGEVTRQALRRLGSRLVPALRSLGHPVLLDLGRLYEGSPVVELLPQVDSLVVVVPAMTVEIDRVDVDRRPFLATASDLRLLLIGEATFRRYKSPKAVEEAVDIPVLGSLADDRRGADRVRSGRPFRRSSLANSARRVAAALVGLEPRLPLPHVEDDAVLETRR